jgi:hypothetical protein
MKLASTLANFVRSIFSRVPIELQLALGVCAGLAVALAWLVWGVGTSGIAPIVAEFLVLKTGWLAVFVVSLGVFAHVYKVYQKRCTQYRLPLGWLLFACYVVLFQALYSHVVALVFSLAQTDRVASMSLWYLQLDTSWGVYAHFETLARVFIETPWLYTLVDVTYSYTLHVAGLAIFIIAFYSTTIARQYLLAVIVSVLVCAPLWLVFPAIAPYQLGVTDDFQETAENEQIATLTEPVLAIHARYPDSAWAGKVTEFSDYWESVTELFGYAVSTNPSTHVILGVLMTWYVWRVSRWLGVLAALFTTFEVIGTMLFLQHYLIDIPFGFLFAVVTIWLTSRLFVWQERTMRVDESLWFAPLQFLSRVGTRLRRWCGRVFTLR